jgi:hypothetical protein
VALRRQRQMCIRDSFYIILMLSNYATKLTKL